MSENTNTYRKIFKSASLFGLVQVSSLVISVIRSKFVAVLIGPAGYGIFSLLNSTVELVRQGTGFSLDVSGVKKISESVTANDCEQISKNASVLLRLSLFTGLLGLLIIVLLSPLLSKWTFGDYDMTLAFVYISVSIVFKQITGAQSAVMQGMSKLRNLAKANLLGNFVGLLISLPLFYFFRINAIVPTVIITSLVSMGSSFLYYKKAGIAASGFTVAQSLKNGKEILFFGGLLSISAFLPVLSNYLIQMYINATAGAEQVGLFGIALVVVNTYVGIIFNALSTEYYPRLSGMGKDNKKISEAVNQQAVLSMLIITPIILLFLGYSGFIIRFLFSDSFSGSIPMTSWLIVAMFFKAVSWSMGYVIIARADSKVFVKTSVIFNFVYLLFCIGGYYFNGLAGLGSGLLLYYIIHLLSIYIITYYRYEIRLSADMIKIFCIGSCMCLGSVLLYKMPQSNLKQAAFLVLIIISLLFSYYEIDKRVDLKSIFIKLKNKIRK
jgi:PST family polysaccharide transporter